MSYATAMALALVVAFLDLITRRIPNSLVILISLSGLMFAAEHAGLNGLAYSLIGLCVGFLLMLPGYFLRATGAGDVKLFAALGCYLGPKLTFWAVIIYYPIAAAIALVFILNILVRRHVYRKMNASRASNRLSAGQGVQASLAGMPRAGHEALLKTRLPMAPAIACATLLAPVVFG